MILSDLAERLGLRSREELLAAIAAGLRVLGRVDAKPLHPKATDAQDALAAAQVPQAVTLAPFV